MMLSGPEVADAAGLDLRAVVAQAALPVGATAHDGLGLAEDQVFGRRAAVVAGVGGSAHSWGRRRRRDHRVAQRGSTTAPGGGSGLAVITEGVDVAGAERRRRTGSHEVVCQAYSVTTARPPARLSVSSNSVA